MSLHGYRPELAGVIPPPSSPHTARIARPRGESKQDYCTPRSFLNLVERKFGPITWDLAATAAHAVTQGGRYFGPDHVLPNERDALCPQLPWPRATGLAWCWLNPPFAAIAPWAKKCAAEASRGCKILLLVPASIGSNWYWSRVAPYARTFSVGRMVFVERHADGSETPVVDSKGKPAPFPKDLMLAAYGLPSGLERWRWQDG